MTDCADFFREQFAIGEGTDSYAHIGRALVAKGYETALAWEQQSASEHSPGIVKNPERVRHTFSAPQINGDQATPAAFSSVASMGMSADRCDHATADETRARLSHHVGHAEYGAEELRAMRDAQNMGDKQLVGVYDTALPNNVAHADVFQICRKSGKYPEFTIKELLFKLTKGRLVFWKTA